MIELLVAAWLTGGTAGVGHALLQALGAPRSDPFQTAVFSVAVGYAALILIVLALGLAGGLYASAIWALVCLWAVGGSYRLLRVLAKYGGVVRLWRPDPRGPGLWLALLAGLGLVFQLVRALAPPHGATDPLAYQLALPRIYLAHHGLSFEPTITGSLYPTNMGLLYVVAEALRNGILAQLLHLGMGVLVCLAIYAFCRRHFSAREGLWGAAIFSFVPVVTVFAPQGYVDVGLCFFQFVALWAVLEWTEAPGRRALLLSAVLTGIAMGVKHQGLTTALVGGAAILGRRLWVDRDPRSAARDLALYGVVALALVAPWYARAWVCAGNPVWPLASGLFGGLPFGSHPVVVSGETGGGGASWWQAIVPPAAWFRDYAESMNPWAWTFRPDGWQKAIGVYFVALLPGVFLFARSRVSLQLAAFCLAYYVLLVRLLHMNPRYGLVLFAVASVLCGGVAHRLATSSLRPVRLLFAAAAVATAVCNVAWSYALAQPLFAVAAGGEGREVFLAREEPGYRMFRYVNESTPPSSRILLQGDVKGYYCQRPYLWDHPHQAVLRYADMDSPARLLERLRELGVTHVARMIQIPPARLALGYPQYFADPFHEEFRRRYLRLVYHDESYAVFEIAYPQSAGDSGDARRS